MPTAITRTRGGVTVRIEVEDAATEEAFKEARKEMNARLKEGLFNAGEKVALPAAKMLAPKRTGRLANALVVRSSSTRAYLTFAGGKRGPAGYAGVINFGGEIRGRIIPKKKKALRIGNRYVANVTAPRHIKGAHFLERAIDSRQEQIKQTVADEVIRAFRGFGEGE